MNVFETLIKQHAIHRLLTLLLFLLRWNTKKYIMVERLKRNRMKLKQMLPIFILSTQSTKQSYYTVDFLKHMIPL